MPTLGPASVQYGDMLGTAALDSHEGNGLHRLASRISAPGFPLALVIHPGLSSQTDEHSVLVTLYTTNVADNRQAIIDYARQHENRIPVQKYHGSVTPAEFRAFAKQFEVVLRLQGFTEFELEHE